MKCPNCGSEVRADDLICEHCGLMLPAPEYWRNRPDYTIYDGNYYYGRTQIPPRPPQPVRPPYNMYQPQRRRKSFYDEIIIILLSLNIVLDVLIVLLIALG